MIGAAYGIRRLAALANLAKAVQRCAQVNEAADGGRTQASHEFTVNRQGTSTDEQSQGSQLPCGAR